MLHNVSFLFKFVFCHEKGKIIGANLTKESVQEILVLVVVDAIIEIDNMTIVLHQCILGVNSIK